MSYTDTDPLRNRFTSHCYLIYHILFKKTLFLCGTKPYILGNNKNNLLIRQKEKKAASTETKNPIYAYSLQSSITLMHSRGGDWEVLEKYVCVFFSEVAAWKTWMSKNGSLILSIILSIFFCWKNYSSHEAGY